MGPSYYDLLGVPPSADAAEIKSAWRKACQQVHPDKGGNNGLFNLVQEAYQTLSDAQRRAEYDQRLNTGDTGFASPPSPPADGRAGEQSAGGHAGGQTTVDFSMLSWVRRVPEEQPPVRVTPGTFRWLPWLSRSAHAVAFVLGWYVTFTYNSGKSYDFELRAFDDFAVIWAASSLASTRHWRVVLPVVLGWLLFGWFDFVAETTGETVLFWGWVVAVVTAAAARGTTSLVSPAWLNRVVPVDVVRKFAVFGPAGTPVGRDTLDTQMAARMGAEAMFGLTMIPAVRLFHAVTVPGSPAVGANHVLVRGRKVAVVNDVSWNPGSYSFSPLGSLLHNHNQFAYGDVDPRPAADAWRRQLPKGVEVRSWVLVGSGSGPVRVDNSHAPDGVRVGTPQQVADEVGSWLTEEEQVPPVDRRVLAVFAQGLPAS